MSIPKLPAVAAKFSELRLIDVNAETVVAAGAVNEMLLAAGCWFPCCNKQSSSFHWTGRRYTPLQPVGGFTTDDVSNGDGIMLPWHTKKIFFCPLTRLCASHSRKDTTTEMPGKIAVFSSSNTASQLRVCKSRNASRPSRAHGPRNTSIHSHLIHSVNRPVLADLYHPTCPHRGGGA